MDEYQFLISNGWVETGWQNGFLLDPLDLKPKSFKGALVSQKMRTKRGQKIVKCPRCRERNYILSPGCLDTVTCTACQMSTKQKNIKKLDHEKINFYVPKKVIPFAKKIQKIKEFDSLAETYRFLIEKGVEACEVETNNG